jgi:hypothetical protein
VGFPLLVPSSEGKKLKIYGGRFMRIWLLGHRERRDVPHAVIQWIIATGGVIYNPSSTIQIADVPIIFPRIPSRSRSDREEIINLVLRDLLDAAGEQSEWPRLVLTD